DPNGRVIAYTLASDALSSRPDASWTRVSNTTLDRSFNGRLLANGDAYITLYTSAPTAHRDHLRRVPAQARQADRGAWPLHAPGDFALRSEADIGLGGALVLPKLFRRANDYLRAVAGGFDGTLPDWIRNPGPGRDEDDRVVIGNEETRLSDLVKQNGDQVSFTADLLDVVFVER